MSARDRYILRTTARAYFVLYLRTLVVFSFARFAKMWTKLVFLPKGGENLLLGNETWKKLFRTRWYLAKIRRNRCNELLRFSLINKLQLCLVSKILLNYIISHGLQIFFIFSNILSSKLFIYKSSKAALVLKRFFIRRKFYLCFIISNPPRVACSQGTIFQGQDHPSPPSCWNVHEESWNIVIKVVFHNRRKGFISYTFPSRLCPSCLPFHLYALMKFRHWHTCGTCVVPACQRSFHPWTVKDIETGGQL